MGSILLASVPFVAQLAAALGQPMASPWFSQSKTLLKDWEPLAMKNNL